MSLDTLIKKALAKQPTVKPRTKRNAQPEAIEQAKDITEARDSLNRHLEMLNEDGLL